MSAMADAFMRSLAGLVLAPIFGGAISLGFLGIFGGGSIGAMASNAVGVAVMGAYVGALYGVIPALVIGWPIHLLLLRQRWTHPLAYAALGPALAVLAMILIALVMGDRLTLRDFF
jgi:hypothetical protein